eukprot:gnl/Trimastix_PCT/4148.p1 GENE.gnl/Trimastix_PCT/4148~~gnl/Trimastix_PCT/4148.p1  ORF type:complete len:410 (+),score=24.67 gnl/Trimastix_PCT/4148:149-1231(+)
MKVRPGFDWNQPPEEWEPQMYIAMGQLLFGIDQHTEEINKQAIVSAFTKNPGEPDVFTITQARERENPDYFRLMRNAFSHMNVGCTVAIRANQPFLFFQGPGLDNRRLKFHVNFVVFEGCVRKALKGAKSEQLAWVQEWVFARTLDYLVMYRRNPTTPVRDLIRDIPCSAFRMIPSFTVLISLREYLNSLEPPKPSLKDILPHIIKFRPFLQLLLCEMRVLLIALHCRLNEAPDRAPRDGAPAAEGQNTCPDFGSIFTPEPIDTIAKVLSRNRAPPLLLDPEAKLELIAHLRNALIHHGLTLHCISDPQVANPAPVVVEFNDRDWKRYTTVGELWDVFMPEFLPVADSLMEQQLARMPRP